MMGMQIWDSCRNRYIVECKDIRLPVMLAPASVEIDTLWNVKGKVCKAGKSRICRNRYIVECKVSFSWIGWIRA